MADGQKQMGIETTLLKGAVWNDWRFKDLSQQEKEDLVAALRGGPEEQKMTVERFYAARAAAREEEARNAFAATGYVASSSPSVTEPPKRGGVLGALLGEVTFFHVLFFGLGVVLATAVFYALRRM